MEPNEIEGRQFGSTLRGYDRQEVEDFAREVADYVRQLTAKLAQVESALEAAKSAPPPAPTPAPSVAAPQKSTATQSQKTDVYKQLGEETARILISAEQAANQIKEEAKREAAEVLADARRDAGRIARQAREGKQKAEGDLHQLLQTRGLLAGQLEDVRRRLAEAVARLQAPLEPTGPGPVQVGPPSDVMPSLPPSRHEKADAAQGSTGGRPPPGDMEESEMTAPTSARTSEPAEKSSRPAEQSSKPAAIEPQHPPAEERHAAERTAASAAGEPALRSVDAPPKEPAPQQHRVGRIIESTQFPPPRLVRPAPAQRSGEGRQKPPVDEPPLSRPIPRDGDRLPTTGGVADDPGTKETPVPRSGLLPREPAQDAPKDAGETKFIATTKAPSNGSKQKSDSPRDIVEQLLEEIREDSKEAPSRPSRKPAAGAASPQPFPAGGPEPAGPSAEPLSPASPRDFFELRRQALAEVPYEAARKLKRLLQEDHNDLLHRLRSQRGRGTLDENIAPEREQLDRFKKALSQVLHRAFAEGRRTAGAAGGGSPDAFVSSLVAKQVVLPLRSEVSRVVEAGLGAKDTPTAISERAGDVFRVWKGVRTELLGEGLVYAAFHEGLLDVWRSDPKKVKRWVLSAEEQECPKGVCRANASMGTVPARDAFASGHAGPPAHGGCTCGLEPF